MSGEEWEHSTASFIVRLKLSPDGVTNEEPVDSTLLGRVEHVQTGRRIAIHRLEELVPFIMRCLKDHAALTLSISLLLADAIFRGMLIAL